MFRECKDNYIQVEERHSSHDSQANDPNNECEHQRTALLPSLSERPRALTISHIPNGISCASDHCDSNVKCTITLDKLAGEITQHTAPDQKRHPR
jgi:hypothetical protein